MLIHRQLFLESSVLSEQKTEMQINCNAIEKIFIREKRKYILNVDFKEVITVITVCHIPLKIKKLLNKINIVMF